MADCEQSESPPEAPALVAEKTTPPSATSGACEVTPPIYLSEDALLTHLRRQSRIVADALQHERRLRASPDALGAAFEKSLFAPRKPPRRGPDGTCEKEPRLNFYPTFIVPETLATYHIFFHNQVIPLSCRANRSGADAALTLQEGERVPLPPTVEEIGRVNTGLGDEQPLADKALEQTESCLVELRGDSPRLAVLKRDLAVTHFAYPALALPPRVMRTVTACLLGRPANMADGEQADADPALQDVPDLSDDELAEWLGVAVEDEDALRSARKRAMAVALVSLQLECMRRLFAHPSVIRRCGETIHYAFQHGYVRLANKLCNINLSHLVSYLGILHENRLGQSTLHSTLRGEARRDYCRDTIFLFLVYTWQTAMGVWQQCLEPDNLKELARALVAARRLVWTGPSERAAAAALADIVFPPRLEETLREGLPDLVSQSMMHIFRCFVLERSGILPAAVNAYPSDFVPTSYAQCPPQLWAHVYLLLHANYLMFHTDVAYDCSGEGVLETHCRCNLCSPHRSLALNHALLAEIQHIGSFELQRPPKPDGAPGPSFKLTPALWGSAFLRKMPEEDYHAEAIRFYERAAQPRANAELSACVITQTNILSQLQEIQKARESFLLKKGRGVYLDPETGEELRGPVEAS